MQTITNYHYDALHCNYEYYLGIAFIKIKIKFNYLCTRVYLSFMDKHLQIITLLFIYIIIW